MDDGWWDDFVRHIVDRVQTPLRCDCCGPGASDWYCRACVSEREDVIRDIARAIGFDGETDAELVEDARSIVRQRDEARAEVERLRSEQSTARAELLERAHAEVERMRVETASALDEMGHALDVLDMEAQCAEQMRGELDQARAAVGEAWFAGGATLAEAIQRKCRALESLGNPRLESRLA